MATLNEQVYNAMVYEIVDAMLTANPTGVQKELEKHNFEFKYGQNSMLAEKYLLQLYQNNRPLFWEIVDNVPVNPMNIPPTQRERITAIVPNNYNATSKTLDDYYHQAIDFLKGTKTEGGSESTTTETSTGAIIASIIAILAILGITFYLLKTLK